MAERAFLSIGDVLALLKDEFPDVTISKIRFLESQGLLDPERTPSGYRKFYETDVDRLRWILRQQREHFLPLKVIKGRLSGGAALPEERTSLGDISNIGHPRENGSELSERPPRSESGPTSSQAPQVQELRPAAAPADHTAASGGWPGGPATLALVGPGPAPSRPAAPVQAFAQSPTSAPPAPLPDPSSASGQSAPAQSVSAQSVSAPAQSAPAQSAPDQSAPAQSAPAQSAPAQPAYAQPAYAQPAPAQAFAAPPQSAAPAAPAAPARYAPVAPAQYAPQAPAGAPQSDGVARPGGPQQGSGPQQGDGPQPGGPQQDGSAQQFGGPHPGGGPESASNAAPQPAPTFASAPPGVTPSPLSAGPAAMSLTADELTRASGLSPDGVAELERYGLLSGRVVAGTTYYDEEAFTVATAAAGFAAHGIEPRHLRMYKTAADREGDLYEQVVTPLLKQRNPQARGRAVADLAELARLGQRLRASLLRVALREHTGG